MRAPESEHPHIVELLARLRGTRPRVHCITNSVAQAFTANTLLALGAIPSMTLSAEEIGPFVASADALLVNLGTFDPERRAAVATAVQVANAQDTPWVLDPVLVDRSPPRTEHARALVAFAPRAIRLNAPELAALAATEDARDLARTARTTVGLTGAHDVVTDGVRAATVANGHALMARVTAMGCAVSAVTAAFLSVERDAFAATLAALTVFGVAGEVAGERAAGPGGFASAMLDTLYAIDAEMLRRARIT